MPGDVDPRYDPQFQRGFRGPAPFADRTVTRDPRLATPPTRPAPAAAPMPMPPAVSGVRVGDVEPGHPTASAVHPIVAAAPLVERPLTANPFVWALLVAGTALVVAGIVSFTAWNALTGGSTQQINFALLQFLLGVTPVLLALGGATLLGVGFLFAIDRQRARGCRGQPIRPRSPGIADQAPRGDPRTSGLDQLHRDTHGVAEREALAIARRP